PVLYPLSLHDALPICDGPDQAQRRLDQCRLAGAIRPDDRHEDSLRYFQVHVPEHGLLPVRDRQVVDLDCGRTVHSAAIPPSACTIVFTLCFTMPMYVPSGVPAVPSASENSSPPIATSCPRAATAACTASTVRRGIDVSTKIAGMRSTAISSASRC